jgi:hypothetical protein
MEKAADINDAFDSILLSEDQLVSEGHLEGLEAGRKSGAKEGVNLGAQKGVEIGEEVGFYAGFATAWIQILEEEAGSAASGGKQQKIVSQLKKLSALAETFPSTNIRDVDILDRLLALRAKFKLVCSLLKVKFAQF